MTDSDTDDAGGAVMTLARERMTGSFFASAASCFCAAGACAGVGVAAFAAGGAAGRTGFASGFGAIAFRRGFDAR